MIDASWTILKSFMPDGRSGQRSRITVGIGSRVRHDGGHRAIRR
jgi:hypothetical protein